MHNGGSLFAATIAVSATTIRRAVAARRRARRSFRLLPGRLALTATCAVLFTFGVAAAETVAVRHKEGLLHEFLVLETAHGSHLADGDLIQTANSDRVTRRLVFDFDDDSQYEETTEFSQTEHVRLISDRLVEHGASFPKPLDLTIDARNGVVSIAYTDDRGHRRKRLKHMALPDDLANGIVPVLLTNVDPDHAPKSFGFVAPTPDPQLVRLELHLSGSDRVSIGDQSRQVLHYVLHVNIGGMTGLFAGLVGRQPPDSHVWTLGGDAPAFIGAEEPLYVQGPLWRIHPIGPSWPESRRAGRQSRPAPDEASDPIPWSR
jgi:hypothetical protein